MSIKETKRIGPVFWAILATAALACAVLLGLDIRRRLSPVPSGDSRLSVDGEGRTVVERYGQLRVEGTDLCAADGTPVQLRGVSSHGLQWYGKYANPAVLLWLRDDWNAQLWRAAMYLGEGGYLSNRVIRNRVYDSVDACIEAGMYVIVDWHVLSDHDPLLHVDEAVEFFSDVARRWGDTPNLIYEICNEPNGEGVTWGGNIKPYAERVIAAIRATDPDNLIIVGTPTWSQDVDIAAADPLDAGPGIMYALHFYAGSHGKELRAKADRALAAGLPIFVTEWGTTLNTGGGDYFPKESLEWLKWMRKRNISWTNWSLNNKGEASGLLAYNADRDAKGGWADDALSPSGRFVRMVLRNEERSLR